MKLILKDGTEFTVATLNISFIPGDPYGKNGRCDLILDPETEPTVTLGKVTSSFTADNLSNCTIKGAEEYTFQFTEFIEAGVFEDSTTDTLSCRALLKYE